MTAIRLMLRPKFVFAGLFQQNDGNLLSILSVAILTMSKKTGRFKLTIGLSSTH